MEQAKNLKLENDYDDDADDDDDDDVDVKAFTPVSNVFSSSRKNYK
jgi:hypothetical protein